MRRKILVWTIQLSLLTAGVAFLFFGIPFLREFLKAAPASTGEADQKNQPQVIGKDTIELAPDVFKSLGVQVARATKCKSGHGLAPLPGSFALDPDRLARVHSRFSGEVIGVGVSRTNDNDNGSEHRTRPLQYGDKVEKGQLLAVVWSKDLGEKKSELVDALSQLRLDEGALQRVENLYRENAIPEARIHEARRAVEASQNAIAKAERTLRAWRLGDDEIAALHSEAKRLSLPGNKRDPRQEDAWARVEVRAPMDGVILEKNFAVGDQVDTALDLFKIADLTRLTVWAHLYEEDLPLLLSLPRPIRWTINVKADNNSIGMSGTIDKIRDIVDPVQHTVLVTGYVDNPDGRLRSGQFITATIETPAADDEIQMPTAALVENGEASILFVQPDPSKARLCERKVTVLRRTRDVVTVRAGPVCAGNWVVTNGALELHNILEKSSAE
ncbi:MAG: efflux RND transporter periplasmic adaptor subunit [Planctomycetes bacterium]|nr:efflux RND transporter periplasmic adaptor subunit [Planctomycetota bacterium]